MKQSQTSLVRMLQVMLVCAIVAANVLLVSGAPKEARDTADACYKCQYKPGGAMGYYADCSESGEMMSLCLYTTITHCYGYRCGGFNEEEEEFEGEGGIPY